MVSNDKDIKCRNEFCTNNISVANDYCEDCANVLLMAIYIEHPRVFSETKKRIWKQASN